MGQPITVVEKRSSSRPNLVRFEINRPLSGMGHERYVAGQTIDDNRPVDEIARRLIAHGGVDAVHINGSVITVDLAKGGSADGLADIVRSLFIHYRDAPASSADVPPRSTASAAS